MNRVGKDNDNDYNDGYDSYMDRLKELMSARGNDDDHETASATISTGPRVLLAARGHEDNVNAFKYALNVCKRIGSQLDILYISVKNRIEPELVEFLALLNQEKIQWRFVPKSGCLKNQIIDYTENNEGIVFVVTESSENLEVNCRRAGVKLTEAWENLKCPLVVVSSAEENQKAHKAHKS